MRKCLSATENQLSQENVTSFCHNLKAPNPKW